jgi:DNA-binding CsgD family transcriptional regulator
MRTLVETMLTPPPSDFPQWLLHLYRLAHSERLEEFQDAALRLLKPVVAFDSAMWGTAATRQDGIDVHTLHLHEKSPEMMVGYEEFKHLDTAPVSMYGQPFSTRGFSTDHWFHRPHERGYRDFLHRHEQRHMFITLEHDPQQSWGHWITLFRADPNAQTLPDEVDRLHQLAPHLMQALTINRRIHLDERRSAHSVTVGVAMADLRGMLYQYDPSFAQLLSQEWPAWRGPRLPATLLESLQRGSGRYRGAHTLLSGQVEHGLLWLRARPRCAADVLATKEATVARLVAQGKSHKEIAQMLQRAPTTVRSQIRTIYQKLGVSNIAQLIETLRHAD